ncbi:hypothetical protein BpHYR1_042260 [Brachionus plicatilis]|uniref:Uncharacterized protein n=1 Tax=Brachionus plicatilis TaxID=10195 RepID=A0A3M7P7P0_BRAPC|nr:hypothetical protein BpHYR1_042260 [Brachionus plicatilis]
MSGIASQKPFFSTHTMFQTETLLQKQNEQNSHNSTAVFSLVTLLFFVNLKIEHFQVSSPPRVTHTTSASKSYTSPLYK